MILSTQTLTSRTAVHCLVGLVDADDAPASTLNGRLLKLETLRLMRLVATAYSASHRLWSGAMFLTDHVCTRLAGVTSRQLAVSRVRGHFSRARGARHRVAAATARITPWCRARRARRRAPGTAPDAMAPRMPLSPSRSGSADGDGAGRAKEGSFVTVAAYR